MRRVVAILLSCLSTSCVPTPDSYPVPPQQRLPAGSEKVLYGEFVGATQPGAESYFIKDIKALEGGSWRWTFSNPELRFTLSSVQNRKFRIEFAIHEVTFKDTGPLTISYLINGHLLETERYTTPGEKQFQKPVPAAWLVAHGENRVLIRIHNPWKAPDDGVYLGILFHNAGFVE